VAAATAGMERCSDAAKAAADAEVGLYKLNSVDPELESVWFQPLSP
jgi:hypothetical protein